MPGGEEKSAITTLNESYKLGGMPLVLVVVGFLVASGGSVTEGTQDYFTGVNPSLIFLIGSLLMVFGAFLWHAETKFKQELQIAMISAASALIEGAGNASPDGANYKVALESSLPLMPEIFNAINKVNKSNNGNSAEGQ